MPEFSMYTLAVFAHIVAAMVLIGGGFVTPLLHSFICEAATLGELRTWLAFGRRASKANPVAALVLLGTGVYLGSFGWWTEPWFFVALAAWVLNAGLAAAVVGRTAGALGRAAAQGGSEPVPATVDALRRSRGWALAHHAMLANDLAILWVMLAKPAAAGSIGILVVAIAVALAVSHLRHGSRDRAISAVGDRRASSGMDDQRRVGDPA